jgi:O-methyltransferase
MLPDGTAFDSPTTAARYVSQLIESRFAGALDRARPAQARGPAGDPEALRLAYLDLLKLCLCDLCGGVTMSAARTLDGRVMSRELSGDQLRLRAVGMDWPLFGMTMLGLARLDDLQSCVESVVRDGVTGDVIEAGGWRGGASILIRATLNSLGDTARTVWVADSFQGFPAGTNGAAHQRLTADLAAFDFLAVPVEEVEENFSRLGLRDRVRFVEGFFEETLPGLSGGTWSIVRLDGDTYQATKIALDSLYDGLAVGGYLIVDDYLSVDECRAAVDEFRAERGITEPIEEVDWSSVRWRRRTPGAPADAATATHPAPAPSPPRPVERPQRARVPAIEEIDLARELDESRRRFAAEFDRLTASPLAGPKAWLRRKLGRPLRPPQ